MKAMLLAAGRGERMRPLTDHTPKPLLKILGKPLIEYHLENLAKAGIQEVVINLAHLPHLFPKTLGDGKRFGLIIHYSQEPEGALETGGGIVKALPLLGKKPFLVINSDVWSDYPLSQLKKLQTPYAVLVDNPPHNQSGDFAIKDNKLSLEGPRFTYSGIGVYSADFFKGNHGERFSLTKLLIEQCHHITAELYKGQWMDIGTPERLKELERLLRR